MGQELPFHLDFLLSSPLWNLYTFFIKLQLFVNSVIYPLYILERDGKYINVYNTVITVYIFLSFLDYKVFRTVNTVLIIKNNGFLTDVCNAILLTNVYKALHFLFLFL